MEKRERERRPEQMRSWLKEALQRDTQRAATFITGCCAATTASISFSTSLLVKEWLQFVCSGFMAVQNWLMFYVRSLLIPQTHMYLLKLRTPTLIHPVK
ncbi:hypothetical protein Patl1_37017 [Pistacia atlantica]|nr:hypothetical protein Patl1_37017 [Pistacia atlantica]